MNRRTKQGFTLIELLVVMAIIAALAALIVWGTSGAGAAKVRSRVRVELSQIENAINSFHKKHGFYPADNGKKLPGNVVNSGLNQLYYELTGTGFDKGANSFTDKLGGTLTSAEIQNIFGANGFANSDPDPQKVQNFLSNLRPSGSALLPNSTTRVLVVPYKGPDGDFNPWHYNSSDPEHNSEGFDLWAEVMINGNKEIIGNWKD